VLAASVNGTLHRRALSLQRKKVPESEFLALDDFPLRSAKATVETAMDFVIIDMDTSLRLACVRASYSREFYLIEGRSVARDQGALSFQVLPTDPHGALPPGTPERPLTASSSSKHAFESTIEEIDEEDTASVVFYDEKNEDDHALV
jgi:hypothetical protein